MLNDISIILIIFTAVFSFILAAGEFAISEKKQIHYIISALFFSIGLITLHFGLEATALLEKIPHFINVNIPFAFLLGPLLFFYFRILLDPSYRVSLRRFIFHLTPSAASLIMLIPFYIQNGFYKREFYTDKITAMSHIVRILYIAAVLSIVIYTIIVFIINMKIFTGKRLIKSITPRLILIIAFELIILFLSMLAAQIFQSDILWRINFIFSFQVIVTIYIMGQRYPHFLRNYTSEASKARYERSQVKGVDTSAAVKRLDDLMRIDKLYTEFEVTLQSVSAKMELTAHQLSEIINNTVGTSFKNYINSWRLKEAQRLLIEQDEYTILRIAYESGFGSKTAFNTFFQKETGMTPGEFRLKYQKKMGPVL